LRYLNFISTDLGISLFLVHKVPLRPLQKFCKPIFKK